MSRKAFTLIELLVVVAIIAILFMMICAGAGGCSMGTGYYSQKQTGVFQCVKTYTVNVDESSSSKRVDLRPQSGGSVETMRCDDDFMAGIYNSATIYAQFEAGKWYSVPSIGFRIVTGKQIGRAHV